MRANSRLKEDDLQVPLMATVEPVRRLLRRGHDMRRDRRWELFECQRCGKCCSEIGLPYDSRNIFQIADHLNLSIEEVISKYYGRIVDDGKAWESEDYKRTPCPFLMAGGGIKCCSIYSVRPSGCKLYPFDTDLGRAGVDCKAAEVVYAKISEEEDA